MRLAVVVLALLLAAPAWGAGPESVTRERLPNGFTVLVRENPLAPVVGVSLLTDMGSRVERADDAGISNFLQAVIVKATLKQSGNEIAERIASLGGKLSAAAEADYGEIKGTALARFWRELLELVAELAREPRLAPADVADERDYVLSRIQRRADNPALRAFDELYAALYGPHPYGLPAIGTRASLTRIEPAAVVAHYRAFYRPERMVLAVSGQVVASEVIAEARRRFADMPAGAGTPDPAIPPPVSSGRRIEVRAPAQQAQILMGGLAPSMSDPDFAAVKVLSTVLGGGMAGRLFAELRDQRGLAYAAASYYDPMRGPGALVLYLGTAPENAVRAEEALRDAVARIQREPVTAEELARAKGYSLGRYAMDRRTNERRAWYLAFYELARVGGEFPDRYRRAIDAVTAADVQRAAQRYLATPTTVVLRPTP